MIYSIGTSLTDALDSLITDERIQPQLAMKILKNFDKVVSDALREKVRAKMTFKGHLHTYRFCDDVWTFIVKDVDFKLDGGELVRAHKVKIVACNSRRAGDA